MAIIGNQGGGGLIYDSAVAQNTINSFTSWTVPSNSVFRGEITSSVTSSIQIVIDNNNWFAATNSAASNNNGMIELGNGATIKTTSGSSVRIYGALYKNA